MVSNTTNGLKSSNFNKNNADTSILLAAMTTETGCLSFLLKKKKGSLAKRGGKTNGKGEGGEADTREGKEEMRSIFFSPFEKSVSCQDLINSDTTIVYHCD